MVYDKACLQIRPQITFTHAELEQLFEAAKSDKAVKSKTLEKLRFIWHYARTKNAYTFQETTVIIK